MNKSNVFKNSFYYMIASLLPMAINFLMLPLFTRFLSPQDYGILALIQSFSSFLPLILSLNIQYSLNRFYFDYSGRQQKILISTIALTLLGFSLIGLTVLLVFSRQILLLVFPNTPENMHILFKLALISTFFLTLTELFKTLLRVEERGKSYMIISLALFGVGIIINVIEVIILNRGAFGMVEATMITAVLTFISFAILNYHSFIFEFDTALLKAPLKFSLPLIPHALSGIIYMYSDRIILGRYVALSAIGLYALSDKFAMIFKIILDQLNLAFQPHFTKVAVVDRTNAVFDAKKLATITLFWGTFIVAAVSIFSVEIVYYTLDKRFFDSWIMIPILSSAYIFRSLYNFESCGLFFEKKTTMIAIITSFAALINLLLNLLFIPVFGVIAAIFSTLASFVFIYIMTIVISYKTFHVGAGNKAIFVCLSYMYVVIIISALLNSGFTLDNPSLLLWVYAVKIFLLFSGLYIGFRIKVLSLNMLIFSGKLSFMAFDKKAKAVTPLEKVCE